MWKVDLSNNNFVGNLSWVEKSFCRQTKGRDSYGLQRLLLHHNAFTGEIPVSRSVVFKSKTNLQSSKPKQWLGLLSLWLYYTEQHLPSSAYFIPFWPISTLMPVISHSHPIVKNLYQLTLPSFGKPLSRHVSCSWSL